MTVKRLTLTEPPPSVNAMWRSVNGRTILSEKGRNWQALAAYELNGKSGIGDTPGPYRIDILLPGRLKGDIDNYSKGILDALHRAGKTPDDKYCVDERVRFHGGDHVAIAIKREDLSEWAPIHTNSKYLTQTRGKSSRSKRAR